MEVVLLAEQLAAALTSHRCKHSLTSARTIAPNMLEARLQIEDVEDEGPAANRRKR